MTSPLRQDLYDYLKSKLNSDNNNSMNFEMIKNTQLETVSDEEVIDVVMKMIKGLSDKDILELKQLWNNILQQRKLAWELSDKLHEKLPLLTITAHFNELQKEMSDKTYQSCHWNKASYDALVELNTNFFSRSKEILLAKLESLKSDPDLFSKEAKFGYTKDEMISFCNTLKTVSSFDSQEWRGINEAVGVACYRLNEWRRKRNTSEPRVSNHYATLHSTSSPKNTAAKGDLVVRESALDLKPH